MREIHRDVRKKTAVLAVHETTQGASSPKVSDVEKATGMHRHISTDGSMLQRKPRPSLERRVGPHVVRVNKPRKLGEQHLAISPNDVQQLVDCNG